MILPRNRRRGDVRPHLGGGPLLIVLLFAGFVLTGRIMVICLDGFYHSRFDLRQQRFGRYMIQIDDAHARNLSYHLKLSYLENNS